MRTIKINETGEVFKSIADAAKKAGVQPQNVTSVLRGFAKTAGGYTFSYVGQGRQVVELVSGRVFESAVEAIKVLGIDKSHAYKMLRGERLQSGSVILKYISRQ